MGGHSLQITTLKKKQKTTTKKNFLNEKIKITGHKANGGNTWSLPKEEENGEEKKTIKWELIEENKTVPKHNNYI